MKLLATILSILILNASSAFGWTVELQQSATVSSLNIKLADVCSNDIPEEYADIILAGNGAPGNKTCISRQQILRKLVFANASAKVRFTGNDYCTVTSAGSQISENKLQKVLIKELSKLLPGKKPGAPESSIELVGKLPEVTISSGWNLTLDTSRTLTPGRNLVRVRLNSGQQNTRFTVTVTCHIWGETASINSLTHEGQLIEPHMVSWSWSDLSETDKAIAIGRESVIGMVAAKRLTEGLTIREPDLNAVPLVHQGEPVEMKIERSGIAVSATGVARRDGALNQIVPVRSDIDGRIVSGRVIGPGLVAWRR
ncbi:MAG: flagellar basal body P-ring formation protein FlgA [bacterium]|nr:flagellar basal body P-ring formation protein FlgA [bacterium]